MPEGGWIDVRLEMVGSESLNVEGRGGMYVLQKDERREEVFEPFLLEKTGYSVPLNKSHVIKYSFFVSDHTKYSLII